MSMKLAKRKVKRAFIYKAKASKKNIGIKRSKVENHNRKVKKKKLKKELDDSASNYNWVHVTRLTLLTLKKERECF